MPKPKIVLLDDDHFLLDMYNLKFSQAGYDVHACYSADEVLTALKDGFDPDAIMFDLILPGTDGFEFLQILKEGKLAPKAVLIALTNQSTDEERKKTEELGADEYIVKANTVPSEVVNMVKEAITAHHRA